MTEELEKAIAALYEVFSRYPLSSNIDYSPLLNLNREEKRLRSKALRDLMSTDLSDYTSKAMTVFGDEDDFKHFLPRILELYVITAQFDLDIIIDKLMMARPFMDNAEKEAVSRFLGAMYRNQEAKFRNAYEEHFEVEELKSAFERFKTGSRSVV